MNCMIKYLLLFISFFYYDTVHAQVPDTGRKWSLQECFKYAAEHNIQVNTLRLNEQISRQVLIAAKGEKIPSLSASVGNSFYNANNNASGNGKLVNQLTSNGNYSLNSSVVLWNDHYINNNIIQKELLNRSAGLSVQQSQNNITLLITTAYLDILLAKENEKYLSDLVNTTTSSVQQAQMLYDAGSIARVGLLQLKAQLASDHYLLVQARNAIRQNMLSLKQILQLPSELPFDIAIPDSVTVVTILPPLKDVQSTALQNFPEISIAKLGVDIAALDISKSKAGFKPVLKANAGLGSGYSDVIIHSVNPKVPYLTQTGNNFYQSLGLTLAIPIFSNRINKTNLQRSRIGYEQAKLNLQNGQLVLSQEVEQAYLNASNAQQAFDAADQQLTAATESYRIVNEQFKLGAINAFDLLQQRNQYVQALQAYTQAKYSAVLQQKIYEFYMGNPVTL